jgi:hypothetical protein
VVSDCNIFKITHDLLNGIEELKTRGIIMMMKMMMMMMMMMMMIMIIIIIIIIIMQSPRLKPMMRNNIQVTQ